MDFERVGKLIRQVRQERGLRLDDLADDYIPRTTLSMIERGLTHNETKVRYLLRKLEVNLSDLSEKEKEEEKKRELDLLLLERKINTDAKKALVQLNKLPAEYNGPWLDYLKGRCRYKLKQYEKTVEFINKALQELEKMPDLAKTNLKSCCLNLLSVIEHYKGNREKALKYASEGLNCFDLSGERKPYYITLVLNKSIYLRSLGRTEKALENLEKIENIDTLDLNIDSVIGLYDLQARLKKEIKLYEEAIDCAKKGLYLAIVNYNYESQLELLIRMGEIYRESGQLEQARKCLEEAVDLKDQITRRNWLVLDAYLELGEVYYQLNDFQRATKALQNTLEIAKRENRMLRYAKALLLMAKSLQADSNLDEAIVHFKKVYEMEIEDKELKSQALYHLSRTYRLIGDNVNYTKYADLYFGLET